MQTQRTTTGQPLSITYDAATNTVIFRELDWFADPLRAGGVPAKSGTPRRPSPGTTSLGARPPKRQRARAA